MILSALLLTAVLGGPARAGELEAAVPDLQAEAAAAIAGQRLLSVVPGIPDAYAIARPPVQDDADPGDGCRAGNLTPDGDLSFCVNEADAHGFTLTNSRSPRINPAGGGVRREYQFSAPRNARREIGLLVYEWGTPDPGADDSAWSMLSEIVFLPRRFVPAIRANGPAYEVTLPTGEIAAFDAATKEIVSGPLKETAPLDRNKDRHARTFAGLKYDGFGVMIRSDQRGDTPRSAVVWEIKKSATASWRGRTCRLSPADLWKQNDKGDGSDGLYPTDAAFFAMLERKCGWKAAELSALPSAPTPP